MQANSKYLPTFAGFALITEARNWRSQYGGWIFESDNGFYYWFNMSLSHAAIIDHPAIKGQSGKFL